MGNGPGDLVIRGTDSTAISNNLCQADSGVSFYNVMRDCGSTAAAGAPALSPLALPEQGLSAPSLPGLQIDGGGDASGLSRLSSYPTDSPSSTSNPDPSTQVLTDVADSVGSFARIKRDFYSFNLSGMINDLEAGVKKLFD